MIKDFPKINSPYIRKTQGDKYLCTNKIDPKCSWIFDDGVIATDKLEGTNICIMIKNNKIHRIFNRQNEKFPFLINEQTKFEGAILEGLANAIKKDWLKKYKEEYIFGELIGEAINGNRHQIKGHLFVPFNYLKEKCKWKSWEDNKYPKNFVVIKEWFKDLPSLFNKRLGLPDIQAEGLVFHNSDGRMTKLRKDMFDFTK